MTGTRIAGIGLIDRSQTLRFRWEGEAMIGYSGDTLASALLANGVRVVGRSFKYHRPRGIFAAGAEEPNAILDVWHNHQHDPNARATLLPLRDGMSARAISGWPNVRYDAFAGLDLLHRFLPAGFYYKTFMAPDWHRYEPNIRRMAGLGTAQKAADTRHYETRHAQIDLLVIGGGPAGLAAASAASTGGRSVILVDENPIFGGSLLWGTDSIDGQIGIAWARDTVSDLVAKGAQLLPNTTAYAYYDHNTIGLVERRSSAAEGWAEDRLWSVQATEVVLATGALERPLVFPQNDRPGIMLASATLRYLRQYGVLVGKSVVLTSNNDSIYDVATALTAAGATVAVADVRAEPGSRALAAQAAGVRVYSCSVVVNTGGINGVAWADIGPSDAKSQRDVTRRIGCDVIASSGGWTPVVHLYSQSGGKLRWDETLSAFVPNIGRQAHQTAGSMAGWQSLAECLASGHKAGGGHGPAPVTEIARLPTPLQPYWHVPIKGARQWLDLQNDVTVKDVGLAARENFQSVEHLKRYTTLGMATDQGKTSNVNGLAVMAELTGRSIGDTGTTTFRQPYTPVSLGAIAGQRHGQLYAPKRQLPAQSEHDAAGALMREYGGWMRPACYPRLGETEALAVQREAGAVRRDGGLFDGSSLGKIEVFGADAAKFLNLIYYNEVANLKPGRLRYVLLLRETGIVYDDGVIARLAEDRYLLSPSSSHTAGVLAMLELWHQTEYPTMDVAFHDVTAAWATIAVCGPGVRDILATLTTDIDLSDAVLPHMALAYGHVMGVSARIARVSFTGERSYELSVPAGYGAALWRHLRAAGPTPYGIESLSILRGEKGYILIGTDTDGLTMPDDIGMPGPLRAKKVDFVGRRSLTTPDGLRADRRQFVGLLPERANFVPMVGTHAITDGATRRSIGWITTSAYSPTLGRSFALGMIEGGRARIGETVTLFDRGKISRATVCSPVFHDAEGAKLHG